MKPEYIVDDVTGCWVWQRYIGPHGYGTAQRTTAHRVIYERHKGPIPPGLQIDHLCRNRACVNPDHLEPVTHAENGRRGAATKLTAAQAEEIKTSGGPAADVAARYGVSEGCIWKIWAGERWEAA